MKKQSRLKIALSIIAAFILLIAILGILFQGLFFMAFPSFYKAIDSSTRLMGYHFACYDMHGGYRCRLQKLPPTQVEENRQREKIFSPFQCHSDSDCAVTASGGCAIKTLFSGRANIQKKCTCLTGPVMFGCMPTDQVPTSLLKTGAQ